MDGPNREDTKEVILAESQAALEEIREHLFVTQWFTAGLLRESASIVAASAHLRLAIEKISLVSFIGHGVLSEEEFGGGRVKSMDDVFKKLKRANPNFWPVSVQLQKKEGMGLPKRLRFVYPASPLPPEDALRAWGQLSSYLHAYGRAGAQHSRGEAMRALSLWGRRINDLMWSFEISNYATGMSLLGEVKDLGDPSSVGLSWIKFDRSRPGGGDVIGRVDNVIHSPHGQGTTPAD